MTSYATRTDLLNLGLPTQTLVGVSTDIQDAELDAASGVADSYLAKRFKLPLVAWGSDLKKVVVKIAAYEILVRVGFNPSMGADVAIANGYNQAMTWLSEISKGNIEPRGVVDSTPTVAEQRPLLSSDAPLNWQWGKTNGF